MIKINAVRRRNGQVRASQAAKKRGLVSGHDFSRAETSRENNGL